jgi:DNA-binding response OmpR family regulator
MSCVEAISEVVAPRPPAPQRIPVLLISTDRSDASIVCSVLEASPVQVTVVRCYREAVTAMGRDSFALVLCDEHLPDGSWKDVLGRIAVFTEPPRLIVIASDPTESLYAEILNLGGWELLVRPIRVEEVLRIVDVGCGKFAGSRRPAARAVPDRSQSAAAS